MFLYWKWNLFLLKSNANEEGRCFLDYAFLIKINVKLTKNRYFCVFFKEQKCWSAQISI